MSKTRPESQKNKIIDYIKLHGSISDDEARKHIGCHRLAARIGELKKKYAIVTDYESYLDSEGKRIRYARYRLAGEEDLI